MSTRGKVARPDGVEESLLLDNQLCFKLYAGSPGTELEFAL